MNKLFIKIRFFFCQSTCDHCYRSTSVGQEIIESAVGEKNRRCALDKSERARQGTEQFAQRAQERNRRECKHSFNYLSLGRNLKLKFDFKHTTKQKLKPISWAKLIKNRVEEIDCIRKGWILEGFPETRAQALALVSIGVLPKHTVILQGSDSMLIERAAGKKVDPKTGGKQ